VLAVNRCVAGNGSKGNPGKLDAPIVISVSHSCVEISYEPPANTDKVIKYMTTYRKDGENDWQSMPETSNLTESITGLDKNSVYEIAVAARYQRGQWGPPTNPIRVETDRFADGKCFYRATVRCYMQSAVMPQWVICLSVCQVP